jgi:hypothetical protein
MCLESALRRLYSRRLASFSCIVSYGVPSLLLVWLGILSQRREDRRRDAWRRFATVVSSDNPGVCYDKYGILCRRRFARIVSWGVPSLLFAWFGIHSLRFDDRLRDARHRFASVLVNDFSRPSYAEYVMLFRRRDDWCRSARRRFARKWRPEAYLLFNRSLVSSERQFSKRSASCRMASRCSS